jgi:hypothetical protein
MRPIPHRAHLKFVQQEGWLAKGTARSNAKQGDHERYSLALETGEVLYTRVSHGPGFWACVNRGIRPSRPKAASPAPKGKVLDPKLLGNLIRKVGMTPAEIEQLSPQEAIDRWKQYLIEGGK